MSIWDNWGAKSLQELDIMRYLIINDANNPKKHTRTGITKTPLAMRRATRRRKNKMARAARREQRRC